MRMSTCVSVVLIVASVCLASTALATMRYALIIGNNRGNMGDAPPLPDLLHAEKEAFRIQRKLVEFANFSAQNVRVVTGKRRSQIIDESRALAAKHRADKKNLGDIPTMFMLFFTGHGLNGKLLTAGNPLTGADLGAIFREFDATFTIGVFDACFSGSLNLERLQAKGVRVMHGFSALEQLPQELLNSEGTMWFTSSRPNQISYEDVKFGGVFTHFFLEGLERGNRTGFGITVEDVWKYARHRTQSYTGAMGRPQTPQMMVRNLTSSGPVFLAFPGGRDATLIFDVNVAGRFLLRYRDNLLLETVTKVAGEPLNVPIYATDIKIVQLDSGTKASQQLQVTSGAEIRITPRHGWTRYQSLGTGMETLRSKGDGLDHLVLTRSVNSAAFLLDLGYSASLGSTCSAVPLSNLQAGLRLYYGHLFTRALLQYGMTSETFKSWGYIVDRLDAGFQLGPVFSLGRVYFSAFADGRWIHQWINYTDGLSRDSNGLAIGGGLNLVIVVLEHPFHLACTLDGGARLEWSPVARISSDNVWRTIPWAGASIGVGLF